MGLHTNSNSKIARFRDSSVTRLRNRERSKSRSKSRECSPKTVPTSEAIPMMRIVTSEVKDAGYQDAMKVKPNTNQSNDGSPKSEETSFIAKNGLHETI